MFCLLFWILTVDELIQSCVLVLVASTFAIIAILRICVRYLHHFAESDYRSSWLAKNRFWTEEARSADHLPVGCLVRLMAVFSERRVFRSPWNGVENPYLWRSLPRCTWSRRLVILSKRAHPASASNRMPTREVNMKKYFLASTLMTIAMVGGGCSSQGIKALANESVLGNTNALVGEQRRAIERSVQKCMKRSGFVFIPKLIPTHQQALSAVFPIASRSDFNRLKKNGYGVAKGSIETIDPNRETFNALDLPTQKQFAASQNSCYSSAQKEIAGSKSSAALKLVVSKTEAFKKSVRIREADHRWSRCMATAGYPNLPARNFQLMEIVRQRAGENADGNTNQERLAKVELEIAHDDANCLSPDLDLRIAEWRKVSGS
jgi:hypothetical protein